MKQKKFTVKPKTGITTIFPEGGKELYGIYDERGKLFCITSRNDDAQDIMLFPELVQCVEIFRDVLLGMPASNHGLVYKKVSSVLERLSKPEEIDYNAAKEIEVKNYVVL